MSERRPFGLKCCMTFCAPKAIPTKLTVLDLHHPKESPSLHNFVRDTEAQHADSGNEGRWKSYPRFYTQFLNGLYTCERLMSFNVLMKPNLNQTNYHHIGHRMLYIIMKD